jgi:DsbC/DsbD-like thiol-disulfide interchange protein
MPNAVGIDAMKRRHLLGASFLTLWPTAVRAQAEQPWSAHLLKGGFMDNAWWAGLAISLEPKWKTYWRVPGDGGIAPLLELTGSNLKSARYLHPLPQRFRDEAGETIGYKNEVVFPMAAEPADAMKPLQLKFKSFFGVCDVVCIPARFEVDLSFDATDRRMACAHSRCGTARHRPLSRGHTA